MGWNLAKQRDMSSSWLFPTGRKSLWATIQRQLKPVLVQGERLCQCWRFWEALSCVLEWPHSKVLHVDIGNSYLDLWKETAAHWCTCSQCSGRLESTSKRHPREGPTVPYDLAVFRWQPRRGHADALFSPPFHGSYLACGGMCQSLVAVKTFVFYCRKWFLSYCRKWWVSPFPYLLDAASKNLSFFIFFFWVGAVEWGNNVLACANLLAHRLAATQKELI